MSLSSNGSTDSSSIKHVKVILLGDSCAGKTAIMKRFIDDTFIENYHTTIGIDFYKKSFKPEDGEEIILQMWDTAGQERFTPLMPNYIRNAAIAVLVFDLSDERSFSNLRRWLSILKTERGPNLRLVLVGNKSDLHHEREIMPQSITSFLGDDLFVPYIETSAKTGENIPELFESIVTLSADIIEDEIPIQRRIRLSVSGQSYNRRRCNC